ncbi:hypothetical protein GCM10010329_82720 [Streptomyces spiroverticillatus]|uniref:Uncharacterized protein n=1 Tax=Streptomyces finlayi TaxID=67296 RepID=A0A918X8R7_9ACTN|nr:hypothetical protein [Streptomyces finlayi]GHA47758.1 hypothetical protein GCM10010329_82720 [Streptomyces spiroverticillatus]GHD18719.1 hypothetical protein GCM10010334_81790 [Streptomyces finlayi]
MAKPPRPAEIVVAGRALVNRDWMAERSGASKVTVGHWYKHRLDAPDEETRFPEKETTVERVDYYDREQFERFLDAHRSKKKKAVLPTDPALYEGDPEERIAIGEAAKLFHFASTAVIRKYLADHPGYFPEPVGTELMPSGKEARVFRRGDLQDFDKRRDGDNIGTGARQTPNPPRGANPETAQRVAVATAFLNEIGGWRRGAAGELAAREGGPAWQWDRAVRTARTQAEQNTQ